MSKEKIINIEAQRSLEAQFEARILRDEKIEAKDWMPVRILNNTKEQNKDAFKKVENLSMFNEFIINGKG